MATYHIWTSQLAKWRLAAESNIHLLDTTAKSGIQAFAPSYQDVMNYKSGHLSEEMYTDIYLRRMRDSKVNHPKVWKQLTEHQRVTVMCYCGAGKFCHRHLFVPEMKQYLEELGHTVILEGELLQAVKPQPVEVIGFHGKQDLLSNWNPSGATIKGVYFDHGEQFMMYCKAMLMGDVRLAQEILYEADPKECKRLGRLVKPFDPVLWEAKRKRIIFIFCLQKAREHQPVRDYLLSTSGKIIAEASKYDKIYGVGLEKGDPRLQDPSQWLGANDLGEIWMQVRSALEQEQKG